VIRNAKPLSSDLAALLAGLEIRYCWDRDPASATDPQRVIRRTMDFGVAADLFDLERIADRALLVESLTTAPAGALRPRSWSYWHYRLGVTPIDHEPPTMPRRRIGSPPSSNGDPGYDGCPSIEVADWPPRDRASPATRVAQPYETTSTLDGLALALDSVLKQAHPDDFRAVADGLRASLTLADGLARAEALFPGMFPAAEAARALSCPGDSGCRAVSDADKIVLRSTIGRNRSPPVRTRSQTK
jgi:hypothetical protein